jgi:hypothetical protein
LADVTQTTLDFFMEKPQTYFCTKCGAVHAAGEHIEGSGSIGLTEGPERGVSEHVEGPESIGLTEGPEQGPEQYG